MKIKQLAAPDAQTPKMSHATIQGPGRLYPGKASDPAAAAITDRVRKAIARGVVDLQPPAVEPPVKDIAQKYEPKAHELAAKAAVRARRIATPHLTVAHIQNGNAISIEHPHSDLEHAQYLLMNALATGEQDFFKELLSQLTTASAQDQKADEQVLNFMICVIKGIQPRDQLETMLAAQLAATHILTMKFAYRLNNAPTSLETLPLQDSAERIFNKLARTFTTQVEALKRYRTSGEQKVRVEHVTVNEGGQAIVGNVTPGGVGSSKKGETTP
jgi:hypothetical protein